MSACTCFVRYPVKMLKRAALAKNNFQSTWNAFRLGTEREVRNDRSWILYLPKLSVHAPGTRLELQKLYRHVDKKETKRLIVSTHNNIARCIIAGVIIKPYTAACIALQFFNQFIINSNAISSV